jgi:putative FmdB family regulatory protein
MEAVQKISEDPLLNCPTCSQDALKKRISAAGFRLKGGGWYETDFKSGKKKNVSGGDSSSGGSSSGASGDSSG